YEVKGCSRLSLRQVETTTKTGGGKRNRRDDAHAKRLVHEMHLKTARCGRGERAVDCVSFWVAGVA
ncbi:MAG: hypothetical protein ACLP3B_26215, partial [Syntrophobacteraceae bacterium]